VKRPACVHSGTVTGCKTNLTISYTAVPCVHASLVFGLSGGQMGLTDFRCHVVACFVLLSVEYTKWSFCIVA